MEYCEFVPGTVDQVSSTGGSPVADPALAALIGALAPGQRPVLRIGGDSTDLGRLDPTAPAQGGPDACPYRPFAVNASMIAAIAALAKATTHGYPRSAAQAPRPERGPGSGRRARRGNRIERDDRSV